MCEHASRALRVQARAKKYARENHLPMSPSFSFSSFFSLAFQRQGVHWRRKRMPRWERKSWMKIGWRRGEKKGPSSIEKQVATSPPGVSGKKSFSLPWTSSSFLFFSPFYFKKKCFFSFSFIGPLLKDMILSGSGNTKKQTRWDSGSIQVKNLP